jgi:FkbM family methyltransferase
MVLLPRSRAKSRFQAWLVEADERDNASMRLVLAILLRSDSNCVDVGAATGGFLGDVIRIAPRGAHVAYEPLLELSRELHIRFPNVDVRQAAVGDSQGEVEFMHVTSSPGWSGLREYQIQTRQRPRIEWRTVSCVRLDDDLPRGYAPTLVKIDVNGAEGLVLRGAQQTLTRYQPIVLFEHGLAAQAYSMSSTEIHALLAECNMDVFDLDGSGPFTASEFAEAARTKWNFVARPRELPL